MVQERERETTTEWRCVQSADGGLSEQESSGEGFKWIKQQGKVHRVVNQHVEGREGGGGGHQGKLEQENQQVGIMGATDLQSGGDGLEVKFKVFKIF